MKTGLSKFANYCRDRNIRCLFVGQADGILFFNVRGKFTERTRRNFERRLQADNPDIGICLAWKGE